MLVSGDSEFGICGAIIYGSFDDIPEYLIRKSKATLLLSLMVWCSFTGI